MARFRVENEIRDGRYWLKREERLCRICGWDEKGWEHVLERCRREGEDEEIRKEIYERIKETLAEDGTGER